MEFLGLELFSCFQELFKNLWIILIFMVSSLKLCSEIEIV